MNQAMQATAVTGSSANIHSVSWRDPRAGDVDVVARALPEAVVAPMVPADDGSYEVWFSTCADMARAAGLRDCAPGVVVVTTAFQQASGMRGGVGPAPAFPADAYAWDVLVVGTDATDEARVWAALNGDLPALNLTRYGIQATAAPTSVGWLLGGVAIASLLLVGAAVHDFGNRSIDLLDEDRRLLRIGLSARQVKRVQRRVLSVPVLTVTPVALVAGFVFIYSGTPSQVTALSLGQAVLAALLTLAVSAVVLGVVAVIQEHAIRSRA
jgi:hypothetical protein